SGPLVRSSYRADRVFEKNNLGLAAPEVPKSGTGTPIPVTQVD
ncbi:MAG: lipoyl synthase, partial [Pseudomonadota bacterium]|nr:lipoyl synthase [Pseudomonadota bacterium]